MCQGKLEQPTIPHLFGGEALVSWGEPEVVERGESPTEDPEPLLFGGDLDN